MVARMLCIAAASLLATAGVQAKEASPPSLMPPYETLDANGDGIVTLPEVVVKAPHLAPRIRHCDTNADQKLSRDEYAACKPKPVNAEAEH